tara:strand:+ start:605 stop:1585 length:981 start_codon:yes stop_codon:yes gene_type:complete
MSNKLTKMLACGVTALTLSMSAQATEWVMASGYADDNFHTRNLRALIADVEELSGGEFKIQLHSNGTLIKLDGIRRAVQSNQVQIGEIRLGVYGNEDPMYILDSIPFLANGYDRAWALKEAQMPYFEKMFARLGLMPLSFSPWTGQGFYTKNEINSLEDFKGQRARVYSKTTAKMGEMLGFETTTLPFSEIPQAFATGLIDALFTSPQTGIDIQAWDNTNHYTVVGALNTKNAVIVNQRAFNRLPDAHKQALLEAGKRASKRGWEYSAQAFKDQLEVLSDKGMKVKDAPEEVMTRMHEIGKVLTDDWRASASPEAIEVLDAYLASQ